MIADDLYKQINNKHPPFVVIDVAEDNENGCSIIYPNLEAKKDY